MVFESWILFIDQYVFNDLQLFSKNIFKIMRGYKLQYFFHSLSLYDF